MLLFVFHTLKCPWACITVKLVQILIKTVWAYLKAHRLLHINSTYNNLKTHSTSALEQFNSQIICAHMNINNVKICIYMKNDLYEKCHCGISYYSVLITSNIFHLYFFEHAKILDFHCLKVVMFEFFSLILNILPFRRVVNNTLGRSCLLISGRQL